VLESRNGKGLFKCVPNAWGIIFHERSVNIENTSTLARYKMCSKMTSENNFAGNNNSMRQKKKYKIGKTNKKKVFLKKRDCIDNHNTNIVENLNLYNMAYPVTYSFYSIIYYHYSPFGWCNLFVIPMII